MSLRTVSSFLAALLMIAGASFPQEFREYETDLPGVKVHPQLEAANISFGDFDKDGDLDILMAGRKDNGYMASFQVLRNEKGKYVRANAVLGLKDSLTESVDWADIDRDGYYDLVLWVKQTVPESSGSSHDSGSIRIYGYDPGQGKFLDKGIDLEPGLNIASAKFRFGDADKDGYPELFMMGIRESGIPGMYARIWKNTGGTLAGDIAGDVIPAYSTVVKWRDIDGDGDSDLLVAGVTLLPEGAARAVRTYRYNGIRFEFFASVPAETGRDGTPFEVSDADVADYNDDHIPDVVLCGYPAATRFFPGKGGEFEEDDFALDTAYRVENGSVSFGDVNQDGLPDLLVSGQASSAPNDHATHVLTNKGGYFDDSFLLFPAFWNSTSFFVDFDQDTNLDVFLSGSYSNELGQDFVLSKIFRNVLGKFDPLSAEVDSLAGERARWGDFDNDGDLDLLACGSSRTAKQCRMYRNEDDPGGRKLVPQASLLDGLYGDPELGDFDGDGRLDVLLAKGFYGAVGASMRLVRNTGNWGFAEVPLHVTGVDPKIIQSARSADIDRDGDQDLAVWGEYTDDFSRCYSGILRNDGNGEFTRIDKGNLPSLCNGELEWGDYDKDGSVDLLLAGDTLSGSGGAFTAVYRNVNGTLLKTGDDFLGLSYAKAAWGDFDGDGDLDFAVSGSDIRTGQRNVPTTLVYRLVNGRFEKFYTADFGMIGDLIWLDYDNDGDLDFVNSGRFFLGLPPNVNLTLAYRNDGPTFTYLIPGDAYISGALDAGDFDGDGDVDLVICGMYMLPHSVGDGVPVLRVYKNSLLAPNLPPSAPSGASSVVGLASAALSWGASADPETRDEGMQYNLRVGTTSGAGDVLAPLSQSPGGRRLAPNPGNAGFIRNAILRNLPHGTYYWSVQGIDMQTAGSSFSSEGSFVVGVPAPVLLSAAPGPGAGSISLKWNKLIQSNFKKYYLHYGTAAAPEARLDSVARAGDTAFTVSGLANGQEYHFRLSAVDVGDNASPYSGELTATPDGTAPAVPDPVTVVAGDRKVVLTWQAAAESDFQCYLVYQRNVAGPVDKIDSITDIHVTSKTITGLKNGTPYSFLVAAKDRVGNQSGFSREAVAVPAYLLTPAAPSLAFGKTGLTGVRDLVLILNNAGDLPVAVDSVRFTDPAFRLAGTLTSLPAKADTGLTVTFAPGKPAGGDFTGALRIYYGGVANPLEIALSGAATALPFCRIEKIAPAEILWDTASPISFLASANDSDNAGQGDRITRYLWSASGAPIGSDALGFTLTPAQLGMGPHLVSLRVVDNEGDTSQPAMAAVTIKSRKPLARLDSISPAGLILRGADHPRFRCTAYDLDENADPAHDGLRTFGLYSTLQGRISGEKDAAFDPNALQLGLHGFYALAVDDEGDTAYSDTSWVPVQTGVGMALIVAGTDFDDNRYFFENIAPNCNWAYSKLRQRGFTDSLIAYFNPVGWQTIGGDYHQNSGIVDETRMTAANLKERILSYKPRLRNGVPLILSFIGHGGRADKQNGKFYLSPTEFVTPDSLDAWLSTYNRDAGGKVTDTLAAPIVIVLDFCYSGSFLPKLRSSSQNRIVITASSPDRQTYFQNGQSFSYAFFKQIAKGGNLAQAWSAGKAWSDANTLMGQDKANPLANADNDNSPTENEDLAAMSRIYIGGSQQDQSPMAEWKDVQIFFDGSGFRVSAVPAGPIHVDTAWFTMLAPDFRKPGPDDEDPFHSYALVRQPDGSFSRDVVLQPVLSGEYLFIVHGLAGGEELMPLAKRSLTGALGLSHLAGTPLRFDLGQNFPNPVSAVTSIPFALTRKGPARLTIWGMDGRVVKTLAMGVMPAGYYVMQWDGTDAAGRHAPPGIYSYALISDEGMKRKMLVRGR
ncbi:MAG TPA: FG-GAP-like repeat-containing protein [Fibrobacteria bacterium]|nr:FG-GAP-like repeat-containing protein [Fibrobacteria bacterium]